MNRIASSSTLAHPTHTDAQAGAWFGCTINATEIDRLKALREEPGAHVAAINDRLTMVEAQLALCLAEYNALA